MARHGLRLLCADGFEVTAFEKVSIKQSFTDPLGSADFDVAPPRPQWQEYKDHLGKGEEVRVYIGDACQGRWVIQEAERVSAVHGGCTLKLHCQSLLCTPYEGNIHPDFKLDGMQDTSIENVVLTVLKPYGFDRIITDATAHVNVVTGKPLPGGKPPPFKLEDLKTKKQTAHEDQSVYQFLSGILARLGAVMHVDGEGVILICAPNYDQETAYAVALVTAAGTGPGGAVDFFLDEVKVKESNKGQFSEVNVTGQADPDDANASRPKSTIYAVDVLPGRCVYRSGLHQFKPSYHKDKKSRDTKQAKTVAQLLLGSKAVHAYTVTGTVDGWISKTGRVWSPNTMVDVFVEPEGLNEPMWVSEVSLTMDAHQGTKAHLTIIPKGALVLGGDKD